MAKSNNITNNKTFFLFTCVKNGRQYITKLFDSLLAQTEINFVHYIYEDGSDDPVEDIVSDYKKNAESIGLEVYYEKQEKNIGLNMSTKHCIEQCFLPYFIWIDCDNWVDPNFFKEMGKSVKNNPDAIVHRSNKHIFDEQLQRIVKEMYPLTEIRKRRYKDNEKLLLLDIYWHSFFAVKTKDYLRVNPSCFLLDEKYFYNDQQVLFFCSLSKLDFVFVKKANSFYYRRKGSESLSGQSISFTKQLLDDFVILKQNANCSNHRVDYLPYFYSYYEIKANWFDHYKTRDYSLCRKLVWEKRKILNKLGVPNSFAYLNVNSVLFCCSFLFPKLMRFIMLERVKNE